MSPYTAISNVDKTLVTLLWNNIKKDTQINSIITDENQISFSSPKGFETDHFKKLSLYLYNITEFSQMRNEPPNKRDTVNNSPFFLTLHYLFTPNTLSTESDHLLLGKIIQVIASNPILRNPILNIDLRISFNSLPNKELNDIWSILETPYRLSAFYSVSPVAIDA
jgi:hypothetical protein